MIRVIYSVTPAFPATDQHPDCIRVSIDGYVVDYIGQLPSLDDVRNFINQASNIGDINYRALIRRIANELIDRNQQYDALLLLKSIGE